MRKRRKQCYSGVGGQAVLEGIMMKNKNKYAVAVRKEDGEIAVETGTYDGVLGDSKVMKIPFIRGFFTFIDSLVLGMRALNKSAEYYDDEEETKDDSKNQLSAIFTTVFAIAIALVIFVGIPYFVADAMKIWVRNTSLLALLEGILRIVLFIGYVAGISLMKDIKRVYMYHGAEHKCINCIERGLELNVENVSKCSREHKRCGTSFMLYVMLISVVLFFFIRVDALWLRLALRILLIPVVAGISYEWIRFAGSHDGVVSRAMSYLGLKLQGLTTREPDKDMMEVAIAAVEAVFDWKAFQQQNEL